MSSMRLTRVVHSFSHRLNDDQLEAMKNHQYKGSNSSMLYQHVLRPFAVFWVELTPRWIAPNTITLVGLLFPSISFVVMGYMNPTFDEPVPSWVLIMCAFNLVFLLHPSTYFILLRSVANAIPYRSSAQKTSALTTYPFPQFVYQTLDNMDGQQARRIGM